MRRADALLSLGVGALALFVGVQVARRRSTHGSTEAERLTGTPAGSLARPDTNTGSPAPARSSQPALPGQARSDVAVTLVRSREAPPERNLDDIRARIAGARDTYMADLLVDGNGQLVRWPDRRERGLRIWVQSLTPIRDWDSRYAQMARDAFDNWEGTGSGRPAAGLPIRFDFVLDSASSDIHVVWIDRFAPEFGQRVGVTRRTNDQYGWLVNAEIVVAVHDSAGRAIPPSELAGIMRHEAGHALGLGHSRDPKTKMYPLEVVSDISPSDRATLTLLYQLPPGPVK